ncbi:MAG TPA: tetratricopeptide repeat protein [Bryobacteraceae bacterium]|nr:tetratricopeptide repeat protein [Bryobacteraceae bacterium]
MRLDSQVTQPWTQSIEVLIASGDLPQARQRLALENASRGETPAGLYLEAKILFSEQRYQEALQVAQRSLTMGPKAPEAYKLAALSAIRLDRLEVAELALKTAAQLDPGDYLVHFHLGALYYTKSLFLAAKPELEKAAQLNSSYMPSLLFLGLALEEVGDETSTVATYRKAIEVADAQRSSREMPYVYLGRFYYRRNRFEDGLPLLEKAAEINPDSGEAWLELGKTLHGLKRDGDALAALKRAATAEVQDPEPHYLLYRILESQGHEEAAQRELLRFEELNKQRPAKDSARRKRPNTP